jgi:hypothetical protein
MFMGNKRIISLYESGLYASLVGTHMSLVVPTVFRAFPSLPILGYFILLPGCPLSTCPLCFSGLSGREVEDMFP